MGKIFLHHRHLEQILDQQHNKYINLIYIMLKDAVRCCIYKLNISNPSHEVRIITKSMMTCHTQMVSLHVVDFSTPTFNENKSKGKI